MITSLIMFSGLFLNEARLLIVCAGLHFPAEGRLLAFHQPLPELRLGSLPVVIRLFLEDCRLRHQRVALVLGSGLLLGFHFLILPSYEMSFQLLTYISGVCLFFLAIHRKIVYFSRAEGWLLSQVSIELSSVFLSLFKRFCKIEELGDQPPAADLFF